MIRLSKITDYGIVLLSYLAGGDGPENHTWTARDLASVSGLPLPTVGKILKLLSRGDLLVSQRGVKGGYRIARPAAAIRLNEVIEVLEGPVTLTECTGPTPGACEYERLCPLQSNWHKINATVLGALSALTIADMSAPKRHPKPREARAQAPEVRA